MERIHIDPLLSVFQLYVGNMAWKGLVLQFIFGVFDAGVEVDYQYGFPI